MIYPAIGTTVGEIDRKRRSYLDLELKNNPNRADLRAHLNRIRKSGIFMVRNNSPIIVGRGPEDGNIFIMPYSNADNEDIHFVPPKSFSWNKLVNQCFTGVLFLGEREYQVYHVFPSMAYGKQEPNLVRAVLYSELFQEHDLLSIDLENYSNPRTSQSRPFLK